jgi:hypothetical protein
METRVPRTNQLPKSELEFYLRLFEKAARELKEQAQSEANQATQEAHNKSRRRPRVRGANHADMGFRSDLDQCVSSVGWLRRRQKIA